MDALDRELIRLRRTLAMRAGLGEIPDEAFDREPAVAYRGLVRAVRRRRARRSVPSAESAAAAPTAAPAEPTPGPPDLPLQAYAGFAATIGRRARGRNSTRQGHTGEGRPYFTRRRMMLIAGAVIVAVGMVAWLLSSGILPWSFDALPRPLP